MLNKIIRQDFNQNIASTILISLLFVVHLGTATSFGLSVDEAHYALFSLNLDWSYFDHPPMVGWLLAPMRMFELNDFIIRIPPTTLMLTNNILLFLVAKKIYPDIKTVAFWSVFLFNLGAAVQLISWGMVPDIPLMLWSLLLVLLLLKMQARNQMKHWLWLGFLFGLLGLSKYTAIIIPIGLGLWLWSQNLLLTWLKQWQFWLAVLVAALLISPVIYWNYQHDWISFGYQIDHGTNGTWQFKNLLTMMVAMFISFSPLLFSLTVIGSAKTLKYQATKAESLILSLGLSYLTMVLWASGNGELLPHWAILGFLLLSPIAAKQLLQLPSGIVSKLGRNIGATLSFFIFISVFVLILAKPTSFNLGLIYKDLVGWKQAAIVAKNIAIKNKITHLWVSHWTEASRIGWYARPMPVQVVTNRTNQFTLWHGNASTKNSAIWIVTNPKQRTKELNPPLGVSCQKLKKFVSVGGNYFEYYKCK